MSSHYLSLSREDLQALLVEIGEKPFRAKQLWQWLHRRRVDDFGTMTDLGKSLRETLAARGVLRRLHAREHRISRDGLTEKWAYAPAGEVDPGDVVETVLIREQRHKRRTVCISCAVGCPLGCVFCATGHGGFLRQLDSGEMIEQVYRVDAHCREADEPGLSNVVFMGMGEPLLNLDAVLATAERLRDADGFALGRRHITLSTVGIPAGIDRLAEEAPQCRLALSLHAPTQPLRQTLIPAAARWPLETLMPAVHRFAAVAGRHLTVEYCLIDTINDSSAQARALAALLAELPAKVNLIPLNPVPDYPGKPPPPPRVRRFQDVLESAGLAVTLRQEKGRDIDAACGQLRRRAAEGDSPASSPQASDENETD